MKYLKQVILLFAVLFLFMAVSQPKNAPTTTTACPSCPGNMRSSADGLSCVPMCDKGDTGCPDVSIGCPTLVAPSVSCTACPLGWHPAGSDKCVSEDRNTFIPCPAFNPAGLANPASVN